MNVNLEPRSGPEIKRHHHSTDKEKQTKTMSYDKNIFPWIMTDNDKNTPEKLA